MNESLTRRFTHAKMIELQGIRLHSSLHDPMHLARGIAVLEADRSAHYAPVTGLQSSLLTGEFSDDSAKARSAVLSLHRRWEDILTLHSIDVTTADSSVALASWLQYLPIYPISTDTGGYKRVLHTKDTSASYSEIWTTVCSVSA